MKKLSALLCLLSFLLCFSARAQYNITYNLKGLKDTLVFLSSVRGSIRTPIDSTLSVKGLIRFNSAKPVPTGVYRIDFGKNLFTDIIINHDTLVMKNELSNLLDKLSVSKSKENKIYYDYWRTAMYSNDSIDMISDLGQKIFEANNHQMTPDLDSMARKAYQLDARLKSFTQKLIAKSKGMYVQKLLQAYMEPDWQVYKTTPGAVKYNSARDFLKEHFFDNIDFSDTTLLNSEVFYVLVTDYLNKFADPQSDTAYTRAVDFMLKKSAVSQPVYNYVLNLFINTFIDAEWEDTFVNLVDNYWNKNRTNVTGWDATLAKRAAAIKSLKPGHPAPAFAMADSKGSAFSLDSLHAKVILLWFWSSTCAHCETVMPQIHDIYRQYHGLGLEIVAVSVDTDSKEWLEGIAKNQMTWINVSDLKGMVSPVVENYNAFSTPAFFLLDASKTIIAHPYSPAQMQQSLEKAFAN